MKARSGAFGLSRRASQTSRSPVTIFFLLCLLAVCKVGGISILLLRLIRCRWCGIHFCVCWSCWRGQAYCCDQCRNAAKRRAHRQAQRRYRQTLKGQKAHREAERRRRMRFARKMRSVQKTVDDRGSTVPSKWCKGLSLRARSTGRAHDFCATAGLGSPGRCHFCGSTGVIVDKFPRRGYGPANYRL